jgi:hypothetical protein
MVLPGHKKSIIATRFNPMRFKSTKSRVKFVFAVATFDSVVLYDTDHDKPIASISNLHYATLTDLAWNYDGTMLFMCSTDGFCSMVEFGLNELGELLPREEWPVMEVQQDKDVKEAVKEPVKEVAAKVSPIKKTLEAPVVQKKRIVPTFLGTSV